MPLMLLVAVIGRAWDVRKIVVKKHQVIIVRSRWEDSTTVTGGQSMLISTDSTLW